MTWYLNGDKVGGIERYIVGDSVSWWRNFLPDNGNVGHFIDNVSSDGNVPLYGNVPSDGNILVYRSLFTRSQSHLISSFYSDLISYSTFSLYRNYKDRSNTSQMNIRVAVQQGYSGTL